MGQNCPKCGASNVLPYDITNVSNRVNIGLVAATRPAVLTADGDAFTALVVPQRLAKQAKAS